MSKLNSWFEERQSGYLYLELAKIEKRQPHHGLFNALADAAFEQSEIWAQQIVQDTGKALPTFAPSIRAKIVVVLMRVVGPRAIRPILASMKVRGISIYSGQHVRPGHPMPTSVDDFGHRHRGANSGGNLRAAVFGVSDGLVSNASLIMGVAGAASEPRFLLIAGVAGLLAGALSMAAGEYVSVRSQRELFEYQIGLEREELEEYPEEEAEELALIYHARGVPLDQARDIADKLMEDKEHALDTLAREELGLNPAELGSPWGAAISSFVAFAFGAAVPLIPFAAGVPKIEVAAILTLGCLFFVGALLSLFTGRSALLSGARLALIGGCAGAITYGIGYALGSV